MNTSPSTMSPPDSMPTELLTQIEQAPLSALDTLKHEYKEEALSHGAYIHQTIASLVLVVDYLKDNVAVARIFLDGPFWRGQKHRDNDAALCRAVVRYVMNASQPHGSLYANALIHAQVVHYYVGTELNWLDIRNELRRKGIHKLLDELKSAKANYDDTGYDDSESQLEETADREADDASDEDLIDEADAPCGSAEARNSPKKVSNEQTKVSGDTDRISKPKSGKRKKQPTAPPFDPNRYGVIDLEALEASDLPHDIDDEVEVRLVRRTDEGGWRKYEVCEVGPAPL